VRAGACLAPGCIDENPVAQIVCRESAGRRRIAQIYARAELDPPPEAMLTLDLLADAAPSGGRQLPDIGAMLQGIPHEADKGPLQPHAMPGESLAALPPDARAGFVQVIAAFDHMLAPRLAPCWLLDRGPELRLAAATALLGRANAGRLEADIASCLPMVRRWLPAGPARAVVDAAIRMRLRQGGAASPAAAWQVQKAFSTLPDGAGARSLAVLLRQGRRRAVAFSQRQAMASSAAMRKPPPGWARATSCPVSSRRAAAKPGQRAALPVVQAP
jgi:hypothetical protein